MKPTERGADIIAFLIKAPRTARELAAVMDLPTSAGRWGSAMDRLQAWLDAFHDAGVIRVGGYRQNPAGGQQARVWAMQTELFGLPDVPSPHVAAAKRFDPAPIASERQGWWGSSQKAPERVGASDA